MIYFIRNPYAGVVKIGHAKDPWKRIAEIQVGNSSRLELAAIEGGDKEREAELHRQFAEHRMRGEWFVYAQPIADYVTVLGEAVKPLSGKTRSFWGMPQKEVARLTGISQSYLSRIQSGDRKPSPEMAIAIQRVTGLSAIKLIFGDLYEEAA